MCLVLPGRGSEAPCSPVLDKRLEESWLTGGTMVPAQDGLTTASGDTLSLPQEQATSQYNRRSQHRLRQVSPGQVRKLGVTRKLRERRDLKEEENPEEERRRHKEQELKPLYKELLYTITHRLGKTSIKEQFDDLQLQRYIMEALNMTEDEHKSLLDSVRAMQHPAYCLMVTVKQAKDVLGKDISGLSDPYCLLTIIHKKEESKKSSQAKSSKVVLKDKMPSKNMYQTDVKTQTLNPIWNQTFVMELDHPEDASLYLEMFDKDEEITLGQKLEEIRSNFHGIKRMIKDAKKEKGQDDFLGNIVLKLKDLHCTEDCWYVLEPRTETYPNRGKCHLQLKFIHRERANALTTGRSAYMNYSGILQQFVHSHISKQQQSSGPWKGELCGQGQTLLELFATQNDLSPFLQDLAKWVAYSKLYQSLEVDPTVLFKQLTSIEYHWDQQELPYQQKQELGDSLHGFLQYGLCLVSKYRDIIPPTPKDTPRLQTLLRVLVQICKTRAFQKLNPAHFDLHEEVIDAVQVGTQEWFNIKKGLHQPMTKEISETVNALSSLIEEVREDIRLSKDVWNKVFVSAVQLDLFTVVYQELDSLLVTEVRVTMGQVDTHMDQALANSLFPVYLNLKAIHKDKAFLQKRTKLLELTDFQECFRDALPFWLNKAYNTTLERVQRAVQLDMLQPLQTGMVPVKHSSSAVDLAACLQPICQLWEHLGWPDPEEGFMLMVKLTEDICKIAVTYCHLIKQRVKELSANSDPGTAVNMLCVVVNDLEYLCTVLTRLPQQLNWGGLRERTDHVIKEMQFNNTLPSQLQHTQSVLTREIRLALETLGKQLRSDIEKHVLSMATRRKFSCTSTEDAVRPLMGYLENELKFMNENLVQESFNSLLAPLWTNSVQILDQVSRQKSGVTEFYQRLHYTLQSLEQCFHAEGNGLSLDTLHSDQFKSLKAHLGLNSLNTCQLIDKFMEKKVREQKDYSGEKYGAVTLIGSYKRSDQKLHIEVLNAVNLIPMDSNGFSDPFVQLSLEPRHVFPEVEHRRTQIKNRELNPLFEEAFEFLVSLEQCNAAGASLLLTVLDHDTIGSDDFEGEAFLSLRAIPGVSGTASQAPTQIRLPLMHPKPNEDNILKLLEARKADRDAQAFVKLRRQKEKLSLEVEQT
ncbi:protein unc-13 homolog D isoform X1 [Paramormyrops kingsleyae]|uniref:protein unc-13 homolog D isoform X1 n=2 Tax=Paramormyrops kingsleyae TaxID=1676925 RepID=UPI003B96ED1F